jgi:hypothetical protein
VGLLKTMATMTKKGNNSVANNKDHPMPHAQTQTQAHIQNKTFKSTILVDN